MIFLSFNRWFYGEKRIHRPKNATSIILLMLFITFSSGFNSAFSQNELISVNIKNGTLLDVLNDIETRTDYRFLYKVEDINSEKKTDLNINQVTIDSILKNLFENSDTEFQVLDTQIILKKKSGTAKDPNSESKNKIDGPPQLVSGTITHDGVPLMGATIIIKGTQRGTTSNGDGYFEIRAPEDAILVVSYLGYETKEIPIQGRSTLQIQLDEGASLLDAVEITGGYYSVKERAQTGNITKIDSDQLEQQVVHSPMEALQGRVAGLQVQSMTGVKGQAPLVTLRGQNSVRGIWYSRPLYIIDGVPIDHSGLSTISSLYDAETGLDPLASLDPSLIESIEVLKDADATAIYGSRGANGVIIINTKRGQAGKTKFELQTETGVSWVGKLMKLMNTDEYLEMRREAFENDGVTPNNSNASDLLLWDQNRYTDWQKELIGGNAEFQKYQASVSGGNAQTAFLVSGGFQKESTVFPGDLGFLNNNLYANINHRSQDHRLQLTTSINYGYQKSNLFHAGIFVNNAARLAPNAPALFDENGNVNWELDEYGNPTFSNPLSGMNNPNTLRMQSLQWNGNISYRFLRGLEAKVNLGINDLELKDKQINFARNFNPIYSPSVRITTLNQRTSTRKSFIIEPQLHHSISFNKHSLRSFIGSTFQKSDNHELSLRAQGFFSESQAGNASLAETKNILSDDLIEYRYAALFGRIGYSYDDKYYLNLTGRRDGSSRFGEKNRFGNFGAVGVAWEIHKEDFIKESLQWINYAKLRSSYGTTGSDNIGDYQYRDTYSNIFIWPGSLSAGGLIPSKLHNPYYHWEKNTKLEVSLDLGLWEDKVYLTSSWYRERTGNQLVDLSLPNITGFDKILGNMAAIVENTGLEFMMQTTPVESQDFKWNSTINLTLPKNKLIDFPDLESSSYASLYVIGQPLGIQKLYNYTGIDSETGKYTFEDINEDGVINHEDKTVLIDYSQKYFGGWYNQLQYKNWNLSFLFEFTKQKGYGLLYTFGNPGARSNAPVEVLDRWQDSNSEGKHQGFTQSYDPNYSQYLGSDAATDNTSYLRMKSLSLNYKLPISLLQNLKIEKAQVYLNAQNLFTLTPYKGYDPQRPSNRALPALTSVHLGIKLTL